MNDQETVKGYVLMIHGLNLKPVKMRPLAQELERMGLSVLNIELSGHRAGTDWSKVTRAIWLSEIKAAYDVLHAQAAQKHLPLFLVGYSLGALMASDLIEQDSSVQFQKMILLSPPLEIHPMAYVAQALTWAPSFRIPSLTPKDYRYNDGTSMAAYKALFQSISAIHNGNFSRLNISTLMIIDPKDEMVSFSKLQNLIRTEDLTAWTVMPVTNKASTLPKPYHHLIIDADAVGATQWKSMIDAIRNHLLGKAS